MKLCSFDARSGKYLRFTWDDQITPRKEKG
jgi:hypothetical protein